MTQQRTFPENVSHPTASHVEARPINGYLTHAIANQPAFFHQSMPGVVITYHRALCGVGRGGMRVVLDRETKEPKPWKGIDGCDRCHARMHKLKLNLIKAAAVLEAQS